MTKETIWVHKQSTLNSTCIKLPYLGFEISIHVDDSAGALPVLGRSDLRIYSGEKDMTEIILGSSYVYRIDVDTLKYVFQRIENYVGGLS